MATKQTSMHTFSGQLGSTVGYAKYGENFERLLGQSKNPKNPKTTKQLAVRAKFKLLTQFANRISGFLNNTMKSSTMPATSAFFKKNYIDAIGGTFPAFELLYDKMKVSTGSLNLPTSPDAAIDSHVLTVSWADNSGIGNAQATDQAMILVYNSVKEEALFNLEAGSRSSRQGSLTLPTVWSGDSVDVWFTMQNPENKRICNSVYLGNFSI